jgi:hypothetical protein
MMHGEQNIKNILVLGFYKNFLLHDILEKLSYFLKETEEHLCCLKSSGGSSFKLYTGQRNEPNLNIGM